MYVAGESSDSVHEYNLTAAYDLSTASFNQSFSVSGRSINPTGIFFKSDGTKMFVVSRTDGTVAEYDLSIAWDISTASFNGPSDGTFLDITSEDTLPEALWFKSDGTKMYVLGSSDNDVNEYDLSTGFDLSTASLTRTFSIASESTSAYALFFKSDGTRMFMSASTGYMYQYDLTTAYNTSTASYTAPSGGLFSVSTEEAAPTGLDFKTDGTKMYITGTSGDDVNEYNLSTAWDITTASYLQNFSVATEDTAPEGLTFKSDGTKMYVVGDDGNDINEYNLTTAWNVTTASYLQNLSASIDTGISETSPRGIHFKPDGTAMFVSGDSLDHIDKHDLSTAWDISTASWTPTGDFHRVYSEETTPFGLDFKSDGTKMYVIGPSGDDVNEYDLSTAWDLSTASYLQNFSVATEDTIPRGLAFKSDGTKMYVVGGAGNDINEYDLSTAWNVTTASYLQNFSVSAQETSPYGIHFKSDGTKVYLAGTSGNDVNEYDLTTAWDISTASFNQSFSVSGDITTIGGVTITSDGGTMYVGEGGSTLNKVVQYSLATAHDISTATYVAELSTFTKTGSIYGLRLGDSETRLFLLESRYDAVVSYTLST
jgi:DNA-binding beta-propeller fold protein YncE